MNELILQSETPDTVYGRLLESTHFTGYGFDRMCTELEWLLEEDRWKSVGYGFDSIDEFLAGINFSEFRIPIEQRKKLVKKLADLRATQRPIAKALGVDQKTVSGDLRTEENSSKRKPEDRLAKEESIDFEENSSTPPAFAPKWTRDPESYTPEQYVESVRHVLGSIDVDPASTDFANELIKATTYYTLEDSGLDKSWHGNVFLNPPYKQPDIRLFIEKLIQEIEAERTTQAILLTNNNTDTRWFVEAAVVSKAICFTQGRINFYKADLRLTQPTNGQAFFYFGDKPDVFAEEFSKYGLIYTVYRIDGDFRRP